MSLEFWDIAADRLRKSLGNNSYKSWIEPLQFISENSGIAEFSVPTSFFGNYVRQHFEDQILYQMRESGLSVTYHFYGWQCGPRGFGASGSSCGHSAREAT